MGLQKPRRPKPDHSDNSVYLRHLLHKAEIRLRRFPIIPAIQPFRASTLLPIGRNERQGIDISPLQISHRATIYPNFSPVLQ